MISRQEVIVSDFAMKYFEAAPENDMLVALSASTKRFKKLLKKNPKEKNRLCLCGGKMDDKGNITTYY